MSTLQKGTIVFRPDMQPERAKTMSALAEYCLDSKDFLAVLIGTHATDLSTRGYRRIISAHICYLSWLFPSLHDSFLFLSAQLQTQDLMKRSLSLTTIPSVRWRPPLLQMLHLESHTVPI